MFQSKRMRAVIRSCAALLLCCLAGAAWADPSFGPELRIGDYGTVPGIAFAPDGTGHVIYRRVNTIYYRFYNGSAWSEERQVSDNNSKCEAEFLDRNQPKITLDPHGVGWIVWGGLVRNVDKNIYLRAVNPNGTFKTGIKKYQYKPELLNPEEVAVSYDPTNDILHIYDIYVGDPTKAEDGHYDLTINPETLALVSVKQLGPPQKNVYGFTGPHRAYGFARLHQIRFYRSKDNGAYDESYLHPGELQYSVGALRFVTRDDRHIHFGIVSTDPTNGKRRDVSYLLYDANTGDHLDEVLVEDQFDSPHGLAFPVATAGGNLFITYDGKRDNGQYAPFYAYRRAGAPANSAFSEPAMFPGYPDQAGCEAPMPFALGESVYVVWGDKVRDGLYARVFYFGDPPPVTTLSAGLLAVLGVCLGGLGMFWIPRRRATVLGLAGLLAINFLGACGGGGGDGNDPTPTPTPEKASVGYRLLRGVDKLDEPKVGAARTYASHNKNDGSNFDYNQYMGRDNDGSYIMANHNGPGVMTRLWMTARIGTSLQNSQPGFSSGAVLKVYVDGALLFAINPNRFFAGELAPFVSPLVGQHSNAKGFFSYVPISFSSSLKVTLTEPYPSGAPYPTERVFYQINVLDLTGQGAVQPSPVLSGGSLTLSADDQPVYQEALTQWRDPLAFANKMTEAGQKANFSTGTAATLEGPGRIKGIRLQVGGTAPSSLEQTRLRISWDGEATPSVDIPLASGWGNYYARSSFQGLLQGATSDGVFYLRFPMPFRQSAKVELVGAASIAGEVYWDKGTQRGDARYFHAGFAQEAISSGGRFLMAQASGAGHVVGLQLGVGVRSDPQALEGDEFLTADGATQIKGTGTEDFFNAHWFFEGGVRSQPLHGTTSVGPRFTPRVNTHRFLVPDLVPFGSSMRFELENGNAPGNTDDYRSVVFYYLAR